VNNLFGAKMAEGENKLSCISKCVNRHQVCVGK